MIIAIDGPAAAGKGTLARALARHFGFAYLDTGLLYRAVGMKIVRDGKDPDDRDAAVAAAGNLRARDLDDSDLRSEAAGAAASRVAAIPEVRAALVAFQRDFAAYPPGNAGGAVLDGRDIGTAICPDADVKLFVTASAVQRARRRFMELNDRGIRATEEMVRTDLEARDARDAKRAVAPMVAADDALLLDTTNLDIDSAFRAAKALIAGD
ncbi:MAG: (d)CMP kinase [Sphingomonadales bacterium]